MKLAFSTIKRHDVYHFEGRTRPRSAYPAARLAFHQGYSRQRSHSFNPFNATLRRSISISNRKNAGFT
jgi:hypothetical protein